MRRSLHLLATLLLAGSLVAACGGEADKELATFQGDGFTVLMPGEPTKSEETANTASGPLKVVIYSSSSRQKAFVVGYTDFPKDLTIDLASAIQGTASAGKGTAQDEVETMHQGFPARDARLANIEDDNGKKGTSFLRMVNANNRLYQLQYIESGDVATAPPKFTEFVTSLKIG